MKTGRRFGIFTAALVCAAGLLPQTAYSALVCAENGKPAAEIVIPAQPNETVQAAAEELQLWVEKISGAKLPIVKKPNAGKNRIVLDPASTKYPGDAAKLKGTDGYSVRTEGNAVYLNAVCPKGVLNGVFRMLYKNTDIIWARPDTEIGTVFTKNPDLTLEQTDYIDIPVFRLRGWQLSRKNQAAGNLWQMRNATNWCTVTPDQATFKAKYGYEQEFGGGHNIVSRYIPEKKYFQTHPEFYPMQDGQRMRPRAFKNSVQLCFTNQEMIKTFIKEIDAQIKGNPQFSIIRVGIEDNHNVCHCPECLKPIRLPGGETVDPKDPAFRSTQYFLFLNQVARHVKKNYPDKWIRTYAYFFTAIPPKCPVEPNIEILFCPISKNSKYKLTDPECKNMMERFQGWVKLTKNLIWREYFGLCGDFPRPIDAVAIPDWKYINGYGSNRTYSEMRGDFVNSGEPGSTWEMNAVYFWAITQGCWDPNRDIAELRREFFQRVFGAAAADVEEFYRLIEEQWNKIPGHSTYRNTPNVEWKKYVVTAGIVPQCRAALEQAAKKVDKPNGAKMLERMRKTFEHYAGMPLSHEIRAVRADGAPDFDPEFQSGTWAECPPSEQFFLNATKKPFPDRTEVRLLYDKKNLYVGVRCRVKNVKKMHYRKHIDGEKVFPWGEGFEVFLTGNWPKKRKPIQVVTDPSGNRFSSGTKSVKWTAKSQITKTGWSALFTIPWEGLNIDPTKQKELKGLFVRHFVPAKKEGGASVKVAVLFSGARHREETFCTVKLLK
ncbi:MAG: DUF4838 domain-containing protein [Lentisphaeria bacterium]|nr:DUF4838 domain-containing protein [Lentisphaeria bacterium]